jgi:hypothetical protein
MIWAAAAAAARFVVVAVAESMTWFVVVGSVVVGSVVVGSVAVGSVVVVLMVPMSVAAAWEAPPPLCRAVGASLLDLLPAGRSCVGVNKGASLVDLLLAGRGCVGVNKGASLVDLLLAGRGCVGSDKGAACVEPGGPSAVRFTGVNFFREAGFFPGRADDVPTLEYRCVCVCACV